MKHFVFLCADVFYMYLFILKYALSVRMFAETSADAILTDDSLSFRVCTEESVFCHYLDSRKSNQGMECDSPAELELI